MDQDVKVGLILYDIPSLLLHLVHQHNWMQFVTVCKHYHDFVTKASWHYYILKYMLCIFTM